MRKYTFSKNGRVYKRISKTAARSAYMDGLTVIICPCNLRPNQYSRGINRKDREHLVIDEIGVMNDFNNLVNSFEYYNCSNTETGKYAAFYIEEV